MSTNVLFQNYVFTPAALAVGQTPPKTISDQTWLMVLSGEVALTEVTGNGPNWFQQTVEFSPNMSVPLEAAIEQYSIPTPPPTDINSTPCFALQYWTLFVTLNSIFDQDEAINAVCARLVRRLRQWHPAPLEPALDGGARDAESLGERGHVQRTTLTPPAQYIGSTRCGSS
jgi:hypothetical protein